jgi:hypothetical protein
LQESEPLAVVSISQEVPKTYYIWKEYQRKHTG